jgi:hypothetical protein
MGNVIVIDITTFMIFKIALPVYLVQTSRIFIKVSTKTYKIFDFSFVKLFNKKAAAKSDF